MSKATQYNARAATSLGWYGMIPLQARLEYPGLDLDPINSVYADQNRFALAVLDYQSNHDGLSRDGMLGPSTWAHIEDTYGDETIPIEWDISSAVLYNQRAANNVGWYGDIPVSAQQEYLGWKNDPVGGTQADKEAFALATHLFQKDMSFNPADVDGKLGPYTWSAIEAMFGEKPDPDSRMYVFENRRRPITGGDEALDTIPFDSPKGMDLHKWGNFNSRQGHKPRLVVIHWGGIDPAHLYRVFSTKDRRVSSHGGVGRGKFYQYLDVQHSAWHAGYVNKYSIGIDICQQPTAQWYDYYRSRAYNVRKIENPAKRPDGSRLGVKNILSLDPEIAEATRRVVFDLCELFDIPVRAPRGSDGLKESGDVWHGVFRRSVLDSGEFQGVIGHHHISTQKWDMACWWDAIFDGTALGNK